MTYLNLPLTDPKDGPKATVSVYPQWIPAARPKVLVQGQPGAGDFVEFVADEETPATLRTIADYLDAFLEAGP
jgi:hypothetical protein